MICFQFNTIYKVQLNFLWTSKYLEAILILKNKLVILSYYTL